MMRNGLVVVVAAASFLVMVLVGGAVSLHVSGVHEWMMEAQRGETETVKRFAAAGLAPSDVLDRVELAMHAIVLPVAAAVTGTIIGLLARGRLWLLTMISTVPWLLVFIANREWSLRAWGAVCGSLLVALGSASLATRISWRARSRRESSQ